MTTPPVPRPDPQQDPLAQIRDLEARFATAMTELYAVGNGLARVRSSLSAAPGPAGVAPVQPQPQTQPQVRPATPPSAPTGVPEVAGPEVHIPVLTGGPGLPGPPAPSGPPRPHWWERPGAVSRVLGVIGAVVTLIGIAMLLAIAIAAGIFGPVPRTVSGAILAVALLAGGAVVRRRSPESPGAAALAATGLATAYLTLLAATAIYGFVPDVVGLVLAALLAVGGFVLARAWDRELLACLAVAPAVLLAPFVGGIEVTATIAFVALLLVGSAFAHLGRQWRWLYLARTAPAVAVLLIGVGVQHDDPLPTLTVAAAAALGMVAAGWVERSRALEHLPTAAAAATGLPLVLGVGLLEERLVASLALATIMLAVSALVASLAPGGGVSRSLWIAPMAVGTVLLLQGATSLDEPAMTGIALAIGTAGYWQVAAWRRSRALAVAGAVLALGSALTFAGPLLATTTTLGLSRLEDPWTVLHGLALTALAPLGLYTATAVLGRRDPTVTRLAGAWAFVTGSATIVATGTWLGSLAGEPQVGFYGGHAVATAAWTALGAVLITVVARRSRNRELWVRLGLGLIAVAIAKLFLFDLSALSGLFRVVAFVVTGLIVLVLGVAYSRATEDETEPPGPPPGPPPVSPSSPQEETEHPTATPSGQV
jgi:uncharacterized membrane protein